MRRSLVPALVAALALTMSVTACGSKDDDPGVATLDGSDGDGSDDGGGEADSEADLEEQALAFSQCMRENGVPDFPDPNVEDGRIEMRIGGPGGGAQLDQDARSEERRVGKDC